MPAPRQSRIGAPRRYVGDTMTISMLGSTCLQMLRFRVSAVREGTEWRAWRTIKKYRDERQRIQR